MKADYIIVGQGLAGSLLWDALGRRGLRAVVVDDGWRTSASRVAAGLMTPLTGRRFTLTSEYPELFSKASAVLGAAGVLRPTDVYRMFADAEQRERGLSRMGDASCEPFIVSTTSGPRELHADLDDPLGGVLMRGAWTDLPAFMRARKAAMTGAGQFIDDAFDPEGFSAGPEGVKWKGVEARGVVFCDGYRSAIRGPFRDLDWKPAKGEALTLRSDAPVPPFILNREGWALSAGADLWRTGTNWEWAVLDEQPAAVQRDKLLARFRGYFSRPVATEVVAHEAGVRPCTSDSRPYLGTHPALPRVHLLNGLGPRGSVWAPAMAELMADHLQRGTTIPPELDLCRALKR